MATYLYFSLLSTNRDSTYRDDETRPTDELNNTNGTHIQKSSSCSSFLIDVLFRSIFNGSKYGKHDTNTIQTGFYSNKK